MIPAALSLRSHPQRLRCLPLRTLLPLVTACLLAGGCSQPSRVKPGAGPAQTVRPHAQNKLLADYVLRPGGLKMQAPAGWGFVPSPRLVQAQCRPEKSNSDLPVILVQQARVSRQLSMESIVTGYSRQITRGTSKPKVIKDQTITVPISGAEAYEVAYTGLLAHQPVVGSQVLVRKGDWLYVLVFLSRRGQYPQARPAFRWFLAHITL